MARSRIGLYSMTRLTSIPHDAVRITVGAASLTVSDDLRLAATVARTSHNVSDGQGF
jgi:hypothetical protein